MSDNLGPVEVEFRIPANFGVEADAAIKKMAGLTDAATRMPNEAKAAMQDLGNATKTEASAMTGAFKGFSDQSTANLKKAIEDQKQLIKDIKADISGLQNQSVGATGQNKKNIAGDLAGAKKALAEEQGTLIGLQKQQAAANNQEEKSQGGLISSLGKWAVGIFTVTAAMKVGKAIIESTEGTAHAFEQAIAASTSATHYFFQSIASGDWSNFWQGMDKAIQGATDYVDAMENVQNMRNQDKLTTPVVDKEIADAYIEITNKVGKTGEKQLADIDNYLGKIQKKYLPLIETSKASFDALLDKASSGTGGKIKAPEIQGFLEQYRSLKDMLDAGEEYNTQIAKSDYLQKQMLSNPAAAASILPSYNESITKLKELGNAGEVAGKKVNQIKLIPFELRGEIADAGKEYKGLMATMEGEGKKMQMRRGTLVDGLAKENEAAAKKAQDESNKSSKAQLEYETEIGRQRISKQIDIDQEALNLQKDGAEKSRQQADLDFKKATVDIAANKAEQLRKLNEVNGGIDKDTGKQTAKYVAALPADDQKQIDEKLVLAEKTRVAKIAEINEKEGERLKGIWSDINDTRLTGLEKQRAAIKEKYDKMAKDAEGNEALLKAIEIERTKANDKSLQDWLGNYKDYAQKRLDVEKKYVTDVAEANANFKGDELKMALEGLDKNRKAALKAINSDEAESIMSTSNLILKLFSDVSQKSIAEIRKIAKESQKMLDYLLNTDNTKITDQTFGGQQFTKEQLIALKTDPKQLQEIKDQTGSVVEVARDADLVFGGFGASVKKMFDGFGKGKNSIADIKKGVDGLQGSFQALSQFVDQATNLLNAISTSEGDAASVAAKSIASVMDTAGATLQGFATGGIVGGVISFAMSVATKIFEAEKAHNEALNKITDDKQKTQEEYNKLLLEQNELLEQAKTIFGTDAFGAAKASISEYAKYLSASRNAIQSLNDATVVTGSHKESSTGVLASLFGATTEVADYSKLLDIYPQLVDAQGRLNQEQAQAILNNEDLNASSRDALQSALDYSKKYEEALKSMDDYLTGVFGSLGNDMMSAIVDNLGNAQDAVDEFGKSSAKTIGKLLEDIAFSLFLADDFKKLSDDSKAVMESTTLTPEEKAAATAKLMEDFQVSVGIDLRKADDWLTPWKQKNPDYFPDSAVSQTSSASKASFANMKEETGSALLGQFTALRMSSSLMADIMNDEKNARASMKQSLEIIAENTSYCRKLERIDITLKSIETDGIKIR